MNHAQTTPEQPSINENTTTVNVKEYYTINNNTKLLGNNKIQTNSTIPHSKKKLKAIHTEVDAKTLNEFKNIVLNKHGKLHSVIGLELEKAMTMYNESESNKQQQTTISTQSLSPHRGDVVVKLQQIKQSLAELVSYPEVNTSSIKAIITSILGDVDKRTFNKYYFAVMKESKTIRTGIYGSLMDVSLFAGYKEEPKIKYTKLIPDGDENLV